MGAPPMGIPHGGSSTGNPPGESPMGDHSWGILEAVENAILDTDKITNINERKKYKGHGVVTLQKKEIRISGKYNKHTNEMEPKTKNNFSNLSNHKMYQGPPNQWLRSAKVQKEDFR